MGRLEIGPGDLLDGGFNIGVAKIVALEKQRFAFFLGQRVSKTVTEVQPGSMPPFAKVAIRFTCHARLIQCHGLHRDLYIAQQIIKSSAQHRISVAINDNSSLNIAGRRHSANLWLFQGFPNRRCLRIIFAGLQ